MSARVWIALAACALALPAAALAQPASQPASRPAAPGGKASDIQAELTVIYEIGEQALNTQESWRLSNGGGKLVSADDAAIDLPPTATRLRLDADVRGFLAAEDSKSIRPNGPIGPGDHGVSGAYQITFSGDEATLRRRVPFSLRGARIIMENVPGLEVTTNVQSERRVRELNGLEFAIWDTAPVPAGGELVLTLRGLPTRPTWPRNLAMAVAIAIVGWMIWSLTRREEQAAAGGPLGALSAHARKERIVAAIELLERDHAEGKVEDKRYQRRHAALMKDLAAALREEAVQAGKVPADDPIRSATG